jgi:hypothetical protein
MHVVSGLRSIAGFTLLALLIITIGLISDGPIPKTLHIISFIGQLCQWGTEILALSALRCHVPTEIIKINLIISKKKKNQNKFHDHGIFSLF